MPKKILILISIMMTVFILTGCGPQIGQEEDNTADGAKKNLTISEIYNKEAFGFYVKNKDNTFTPVMKYAGGFETQATEYSADRYIWWSNQGTGKKALNYDKLIPTVSKDKPLVAIFGDANSIPEQCVIEEYEFEGYTIGTSVSLGEDEHSMYFEPAKICKNSSFEKAIGNAKLDQLVQINKINDSSKLPYSNVDTDINMLLGLEKNKYYKISAYEGTKNVTVSVKADTKVFKSSDLMTLSIPYTKTDKQYFVVNIPDNLESGYYYINEAGVFKKD